MYSLDVGIRKRKNHLISVLKAKALGGALKPEQVAQFEMMYRRAVTPQEQDQVTKVIEEFMHGWKTAPDVYSRIRQAVEFEDDDDPLPPVLQAALDRSQAGAVGKR